MRRTDQEVLDLLNKHAGQTKTWDTFVGWFNSMSLQTWTSRDGSCQASLKLAGKTYVVSEPGLTSALMALVLEMYPDQHECINDWLDTL